MTEPCDLPAIEARRLIGAKKLSPVELLESCLKRIGEVDGALHCITAMDVEATRAAAKAAEADVMAGRDLDLLHGLPVGVKDLQATAGLRTTWGSLQFKDHVPAEDEASVGNVRAAGGIILAKTNTPEWGAGSNTRNSVFGATGNPFDPVKTCGGSSGGSAVALACGMVPVATGSDYGGSLRTPASFCGIVGFRPSPGVVPSFERLALLSPFGVTGPMGRTVADAHLLLKAQLGTDKRDPFSSDDNLRIPDELSGIDLASVRVAISADLGCAPLDANIRKAFERKVKTFRGAFAQAQDRDPELGPDVHECFEILRGVHFVAAHKERVAKHREITGPNIIDNVERGLRYTLADVAWAMTEQGRLMKRYMALFEEVDVLICPASSVSPFPHETWYPAEVNGRRMPTYMRWLAITYALTMCLPCSVCLPCGLDHEGMPFGIQVAGPNGADAVVLEVAHALEQVLAANKETARPLPDLARLAAAGKGGGAKGKAKRAGKA
jgi:Asp-tRNA(Asn)/Glu-tRNA(Gln) amidotransferase A subunit family amidase